MANLDGYNLISLAEENLMAVLSVKLEENLVNRLVDDFRSRAEEIVHKEVKHLSVKGVETFRDLTKMRDEVTVYCEWEGS